jgi:hypothetical protein
MKYATAMCSKFGDDQMVFPDKFVATAGVLDPLFAKTLACSRQKKLAK